MAGVGDAGAGGRLPPGTAAEVDAAPDLTAAAVEVIPPEIVAQSLGQYVRGWFARVRGGDAGILPVVAALVAVTVVFQVVSPNHIFLSPGNLVNLFDQSAVFIVLGMGEIFVLLLGEIDLSIGYVAAIGGILAVQFVAARATTGRGGRRSSPHCSSCAVIGAIHGIIITRLRLPSFIVTLAGNLFWFGVMIIILGPAGGVAITSTVHDNQKVLYGDRLRVHRTADELDRAGGHRRTARRIHVAA